MANDIKNSTARIWTKAELKVTVNQAKAGGYKVSVLDGITTITHPNGDIILESLILNGRAMVRIDQSYFGK